MSEIEVSEFVDDKTVTEYTPKGLEMAVKREDNNVLEEIAHLVRGLESEDTSEVCEISLSRFETDEGESDTYDLSFKFTDRVPIMVNGKINDGTIKVNSIGLGNITLRYRT